MEFFQISICKLIFNKVILPVILHSNFRSCSYSFTSRRSPKYI